MRGLRLLINPGTLKSPYDARWQRYRLSFLRRNPLCVRCLEAGRTTAANTVDHIVPHRGDERLFLDPNNHQSLCANCHSSSKQREEKGGSGHYQGSNADGTPLDPRHRWNVTDSTDEATVERYRQSGASL